jgi:hypothetical protein
MKVVQMIRIMTGAGWLAWVIGCATAPAALITPSPKLAAAQTLSSPGSLIVYSRWSRRSDDQNMASTYPVWYQHTDYRVYNLQGKIVKRVDNTVGHYATDPRVVQLPGGDYVLKAQAADREWLKVPVTIRPGATTEVHLDGAGGPPGDVPEARVINNPDGKPVGWQR